MAQKILHPKTGSLLGVKVNAEELGKAFGLSPDTVEGAPRLFGKGRDGLYFIDGQETMDSWKKRAAILKTGTTPKRIEEIERSGDLDRFSKLAEKCPSGIDVDMLRSYISIVLQQEQKGVKMGPEQLARSVNMSKTDSEGNLVPDIEQAARHIRLLMATPAPNSSGEMLLSEGQGEWEGQWRHQGYADFLSAS